MGLVGDRYQPLRTLGEDYYSWSGIAIDTYLQEPCWIRWAPGLAYIRPEMIAEWNELIEKYRSLHPLGPRMTSGYLTGTGDALIALPVPADAWNWAREPMHGSVGARQLLAPAKLLTAGEQHGLTLDRDSSLAEQIIVSRTGTNLYPHWQFGDTVEARWKLRTLLDETMGWEWAGSPPRSCGEIYERLPAWAAGASLEVRPPQVKLNTVSRSRKIAREALILAALAGTALAGGLGWTYLFPEPLPDLTKATIASAKHVLDEGGWNTKIIRKPSREYMAGTILKQAPAAGHKLREGETVTLTVSSGPPWPKVPALDGISALDAELDLESRGLRSVRASDDPTATDSEPPAYESATVISTYPPAGRHVKPHSVVTLYVTPVKQ